jgi:hypothetical protein
MQGLPFATIYSQTLNETGFHDRLANQLKANKTAACRRAIQRILVRIAQGSSVMSMRFVVNRNLHRLMLD